MKVRKETKRKKSVQYSECIWNVTEGNKESRINRPTKLTEQFFETMQVPKPLSDVDSGAADIDLLIEKLTQHRLLKLGEHSTVTFNASGDFSHCALIGRINR